MNGLYHFIACICGSNNSMHLKYIDARLQWTAIITRCNKKSMHPSLQWPRQKINQDLHLQKTPHTSPSRASCEGWGVYCKYSENVPALERHHTVFCWISDTLIIPVFRQLHVLSSHLELWHWFYRTDGYITLWHVHCLALLQFEYGILSGHQIACRYHST